MTTAPFLRCGVEPICGALAIAPSTYHAARSRPPSARKRRDERLRLEIGRIYQGHYAVHGSRKLWRGLRPGGIEVGRDRVARLMGDLGLFGAARDKTGRTTIPGELSARPADLVKCTFSAPAPYRLRVADAGLRVILIPQWGINGAAVAAAAGVALWNVVLWRIGPPAFGDEAHDPRWGGLARSQITLRLSARPSASGRTRDAGARTIQHDLPRRHHR